MTTDAGLAVEGLQVRYGGRAALAGVCLAVAPGGILGLFGGNGAGKSTLLRAAAGLVRASAGRVLLDGRDVRRARARAGLRMVPETPAVFSHLSGRAHIALVAAAFGADERPALAAAEALGLAPRLAERAGGWSQGMRQRLALALACCGAPRCVLLDDPFSALDPGAARQALGVVRGLARERGAAVLLAGQRVREAAGIIDGWAVLHEGRAAGAARDVVRNGAGEPDAAATAAAIEAALEAAWA